MIVILACLMDFIFGTPEYFPNVGTFMDFIIEKEEHIIKKRVTNPATLVVLGGIVSVVNILGIFALSLIIIRLFSFNKYLQLVIMVHMAYMCLDIKQLKKEAREIKLELKKSTKRGQARLRSLVTRDTNRLSDQGIIRACVEAIGKNACDWAIGPLCFLILGPSYALAYKMVVVMDDRLSAKDQMYEKFALVNSYIYMVLDFIPARLTSLFMLVGTVGRFNRKNGRIITIRDHKNHTNINLGWPQSTLAGLLGIRLGGGAFFNGIYIEKPYIGDDLRPIRAKDIDDSTKIMNRAVLVFIIIYIIVELIKTYAIK